MIRLLVNFLEALLNTFYQGSDRAIELQAVQIIQEAEKEPVKALTLIHPQENQNHHAT